MHQTLLVVEINEPLVLGYDFFEQHDCIINFDRNTLKINGKAVTCSLESKLSSLFRIRVKHHVSMPPRSEVIIKAYIRTREGEVLPLNSCWKGTPPYHLPRVYLLPVH